MGKDTIVELSMKKIYFRSCCIVCAVNWIWLSLCVVAWKFGSQYYFNQFVTVPSFIYYINLLPCSFAFVCFSLGWSCRMKKTGGVNWKLGIAYAHSTMPVTASR